MCVISYIIISIREATVMFTINLRREKKLGNRGFKLDGVNNKDIVPIKIELNIDQQWKKTSKLKTSPSATFGKALRDSSPNSIVFRPGPGSYQLAQSDFNKRFIYHKTVHNKKRNTEDVQNEGSPSNINKHSFYKNRSQSKFQIKVPLHANSQEENEKLRQSKTSKPHRLQVIDKQKIPGPGTYDISLSLVQAKKYLFTKAVRKLTESNNNPGPGDYQAQRSMLNHEGGSISRMKRLFNYQTPTPGPGFYKQVSMNSIKKKDSFAIINKSYETAPKKSRDTPGPGSYLKGQSIKNTKITGGVIGRSVMLAKTQDSPGPLSYSPNFKDVLTKSASVVIGKSNIKNKADTMYGYNSYKIQRHDNYLKRQLTDLGNTNINKNIDRYSKLKQNGRNDITKSGV